MRRLPSLSPTNPQNLTPIQAKHPPIESTPVGVLPGSACIPLLGRHPSAPARSFRTVCMLRPAWGHLFLGSLIQLSLCSFRYSVIPHAIDWDWLRL